MLTADIKNSIEESVLCWLATVDEEGAPNCSPKEIFTYRGENEIVIANIASPQSIANIEVNPSVCVSFVHVFKQKGFKLRGRATYVTPEDYVYSELFKIVQPLAGDFPIQGIIHIKVNFVSPIVAPSYFFVHDTTEESQIESAKQTYGV